MSNRYLGYAHGGYDYINGMSMLERERVEWEREKELRQQQWLTYEEDCENWIKKRYTLLQKREEEMTLREQEIANRGKEIGKRERVLEEETVKVLEQYKRAKKLERQAKRREERIQKAQHEHFSVVYTTLQLGLKSLQTSSESSRSPSPLEQVDSSPPPNWVPSTSPQAQHLRIALEPLATSYGKPQLFKFGKPKVPLPIFATHPKTIALSKEHSPRACTPTDKDELDNSSFSGTSNDSVPYAVLSEPTVEAVNLMSTQRDPLRGQASVIDSNASLINVNRKKLNGKYSADDEDPPTVVCHTCTTLFPSGSGTTSLPRVDKHNPHVDWGPLF
jgi:hypothetical protein